jgi:tetraacyldisaccharide 4'-kinase
MGGAGKTPLVDHIARRLAEAGKNPAILTRGYRRKSATRAVVIPRGETAPIELTGDEAQMFVRSGAAHVGICAQRWEVGDRMERELHPDVFLLDDGFQHVQLKRDEDIVLIDALNPLAGGLFPLGRRREPLESLRRASAIVITRVDHLKDAMEVAGIERLIRRYNAKAPIFRCRIVPREWVDFEGGAPYALASVPFRRVAAFCGLGTPKSFWNTLAQLNLDIVSTWAFEDHHAYRAEDLRRLKQQAQAAGAEVLVTTEKDIMNLREGAAELAAPIKIFWLKIGLEIDREKEFLARIL